MEGMISLLLFAGIFYFMMRFGYGARMLHGHHKGHGGHDAGAGCGLRYPAATRPERPPRAQAEGK